MRCAGSGFANTSLQLSYLISPFKNKQTELTLFFFSPPSPSFAQAGKQPTSSETPSRRRLGAAGPGAPRTCDEEGFAPCKRRCLKYRASVVPAQASGTRYLWKARTASSRSRCKHPEAAATPENPSPYSSRYRYNPTDHAPREGMPISPSPSLSSPWGAWLSTESPV